MGYDLDKLRKCPQPKVVGRMEKGKFHEVIRTRRSVRRYRDAPVPRHVLERLLEAAIWAPSAHNDQPWYFVVVTKPDVKRRLLEAMGSRWRADLLADGLSPERVEHELQRSARRLLAAPVWVLFFLDTGYVAGHDDPRRRRAEYASMVQSVAAAIQNFLLAAHVEGLGACWRVAPLFCPDEVCRALDLPPNYQAQALITLGYPAEKPTSTRKPLDELVKWL